MTKDESPLSRPGRASQQTMLTIVQRSRAIDRLLEEIKTAINNKQN